MRRVIQVESRDSAFFYAILESLEGMVSYSTLPTEEEGARYRRIVLFVPAGFVEEINVVLEGLRRRIPLVELEES